MDRPEWATSTPGPGLPVWEDCPHPTHTPRSALAALGVRWQCGGQCQGLQPARPDRVSAVPLVTAKSSAPSNTLLTGLSRHGRAVFVGYLKEGPAAPAQLLHLALPYMDTLPAFATHIPCLTCHVFQERVL